VPPPAPRVEPAREPEFDIGLAVDLDSVVVQPVTRLALHVGSGQRDETVGESIGPVSVHLRNGVWSIEWVDEAKAVRVTPLPPLDTLWVKGVERDAAAHRLRWNAKTWRGTGKVFVGPRGKLTWALRLGLETYLVGVVPGEIGALATNLAQAGRAQAIAARSYSLYYRGRRSTEGFDLYGTVEDQVYGPIESERPIATEVVRGTAGWTALYASHPIRANYCSTCGGITAEVPEAWPQPEFAYLKSHRDASGPADNCGASPHHRWTEKWSAAEFLANLVKYGPQFGVPSPAGGIGELIDVVVEQRSTSGRVWNLRVSGSNGTIRIPAYVLRQVLRRGGNASAILRSNLFKIDVRRDKTTRRAIEVVASGAGSGHGVGLCQTGALGMARGGRTSEQILRHYYPGIDLKRLY
jgi:stage II sporulation protein D